MNKIIQILKVVGKYAWLFPTIKQIIINVADGIKQARKDGNVTGNEVALIIISCIRDIAGIFDVEDGVDDEVIALIQKKFEGKPIKIKLNK